MINRGTILLGRLVDEKPIINTECDTKKFDVAHYEKTGEIVYLDKGKTQEITGTFANEQQMKSEIKTIEQFEAIGNVTDVAKKYNIEASTAHGYKLSLKAKARRESAKQLLPGSVESELAVEKQKSTPERLVGLTVDDCALNNNQQLTSQNLEGVEDMARGIAMEKPSREQLILDQQAMSKKEAMEKYGCGKSTIEKWGRDYGLPQWINHQWDNSPKRQGKGCETVKSEIVGDNGKVGDCGENMLPRADECNFATTDEQKAITVDDVNLGEVPFAEGKTSCFGEYYDCNTWKCEQNAKCQDENSRISKDLAEFEPQQKQEVKPWCLGNPDVFIECHAKCADMLECTNAIPLEGLAEPEPAWMPEANHEENLWAIVRKTYEEIRKLGHREVDIKNANKLKELVRGL